MADDTDKAEPSAPTCLADPNFAVICSFLDKFAAQVGVQVLPFTQLQEMLEDQDQVSQALTDLHVKLLRKARKSFTLDKWEKALTKFAHSYSQQDGWELERFGYKKASLGVKLRLLKTLLEAQFDINTKFKNEVNKLAPQELRVEPLGRDQEGLVYWCQFDPACNVRVYCEDTDEESWDLVAQDRVGLVKLIDGLSSGEGQQTLDMILEEEAALEAEKPVIDTGQDDNDDEEEEENGEENDDEKPDEEEEDEESGDSEEHDEPKQEEPGKKKDKSAENEPAQETKEEHTESEPKKDNTEKPVESELQKETKIGEISGRFSETKPQVLTSDKPKLEQVKIENSEVTADEKSITLPVLQPKASAVLSKNSMGPKATATRIITNDNRPITNNGSLDISARPLPPKPTHRPGSRLEEIFKMKMDRPVNPYPEDKTSILSQMAARFNCPEEAAEDLSAPSKKPRLDDTVTNGASRNDPIVGEAIEENVMIVRGEGSGADCNAGNPLLDYDSKTDPDLEVIAIFNASSEESVREALSACILEDSDSSKSSENNTVTHKFDKTTKGTLHCTQKFTDSEIDILNRIRLINSSFSEKPIESDSNFCAPDPPDSKEFVFEASEVIEEDIMYFSGCGAGHDCDTGNPNEPSSEKPSTSEGNQEPEKKPKKLWSIETICRPNDESKSETKCKLDDTNGPSSAVPCNLSDVNTVEKKGESDEPLERPSVSDASESKTGVENGQKGSGDAQEKTSAPPKKSVFLSNLIEHCLVNKAENKTGAGEEPPAGDKYEDLFSAKNILGPSNPEKSAAECSALDKIPEVKLAATKPEVTPSVPTKSVNPVTSEKSNLAKKSENPITSKEFTEVTKSVNPIKSGKSTEVKKEDPITSEKPIVVKKSSNLTTSETPTERKKSANPITSGKPTESNKAEDSITSENPTEGKKTEDPITSEKPAESKKSATSITSENPTEKSKDPTTTSEKSAATKSLYDPITSEEAKKSVLIDTQSTTAKTVTNEGCRKDRPIVNDTTEQSGDSSIDLSVKKVDKTQESKTVYSMKGTYETSETKKPNSDCKDEEKLVDKETRGSKDSGLLIGQGVDLDKPGIPVMPVIVEPISMKIDDRQQKKVLADEKTYLKPPGVTVDSQKPNDDASEKDAPPKLLKEEPTKKTPPGDVEKQASGAAAKSVGESKEHADESSKEDSSFKLLKDRAMKETIPNDVEKQATDNAAKNNYDPKTVTSAQAALDDVEKQASGALVMSTVEPKVDTSVEAEKRTTHGDVAKQSAGASAKSTVGTSAEAVKEAAPGDIEKQAAERLPKSTAEPRKATSAEVEKKPTHSEVAKQSADASAKSTVGTLEEAVKEVFTVEPTKATSSAQVEKKPTHGEVAKQSADASAKITVSTSEEAGKEVGTVEPTKATSAQAEKKSTPGEVVEQSGDDASATVDPKRGTPQVEKKTIDVPHVSKYFEESNVKNTETAKKPGGSVKSSKTAEPVKKPDDPGKEVITSMPAEISELDNTVRKLDERKLETRSDTENKNQTLVLQKHAGKAVIKKLPEQSMKSDCERKTEQVVQVDGEKLVNLDEKTVEKKPSKKGAEHVNQPEVQKAVGVQKHMKADEQPVEKDKKSSGDDGGEKIPKTEEKAVVGPLDAKKTRTKPRIGPKSKMKEWAKSAEKPGGNWLMQMQGMVDSIEKYEPDKKEQPKPNVVKEELQPPPSDVKTETKAEVKKATEPAKKIVKEQPAKGETKEESENVAAATSVEKDAVHDESSEKATKSEEKVDKMAMKCEEKDESKCLKEEKTDSENPVEKPKGRKSRTNSLNADDEVPSKVRKTGDDTESPKETVPRRGSRRSSRAASLTNPAEVEVKKGVDEQVKEEPKIEEAPVKKVFSLSTFSLEEPLEDLTPKATPTKVPPVVPPVKGGKRKRGAQAAGKSEEEGTEEDESKVEKEDGEVGGKKPRLRGKVKRGGKRKRGKGGFRGTKESTSDQDSKVEDAKSEAGKNEEPAKEPTEVKGKQNDKKQGEVRKEKDDSDDDVPLAKRGRGHEKAAKEDAPKTDQKEETPRKGQRRPKKQTLLGLTEADLKSVSSTPESPIGMRTSRRIALQKIKEEAEKQAIEKAIKQIEKGDKKKKKDVSGGKGNKEVSKKETPGKGKRKTKHETDEEEEEEPPQDDKKDGKFRKKKKDVTKFNIKKYNTGNPWASSSDDEDENLEEEEEDHLEFMGMDDDEEVGKVMSDHEFSCDEDLEKDGDGEHLPVKRARTAVRKEKSEKKEEDEAEDDDMEDYKCEKCGAGDHPEWILLCDTCDKGYHASCLRPPLMLIPEGDWFCPLCSHASLVKKLKDVLRTFERNTKKRENEELRRKRLAYVGISLANVLPDSVGNKVKKEKKHKKRPGYEENGSSSEDSGSSRSSSEDSRSESSEESDDEPIYQLRQRRSTTQNYRFNDYDQMIDSAIQDEMVAAGTAPPLATVATSASNSEPVESGAAGVGQEGAEVPAENGEVPETKEEGGEREEDEGEDEEKLKEEEEDEGDISKGWRPPVVPRRPPPTFTGRRKPKKLCNLDVESDDQNDSDEDFKGSDSDEEEEDFSDASDESGDYRRSRQPVRRSGRARQARVDRDFINDDSDDDDYGPKSKKKKKKQVWDESESSDSDRSWGRRKKKAATRSSFSKAKSRSKKKKKSKRHDSDSDAPKKKSKPKKPKIRYGLSEDDEDDGPLIKTRGKKINYTEFHGSDTEEEERLNRIKGRKTLSDMEAEDEEFVLDKDEEEEFMGGQSQFRKAPRRISSGDDSEEDDAKDAKSDDKSSGVNPKEKKDSVKTTPIKSTQAEKPKPAEKKTEETKTAGKSLPPASQHLPASKPKSSPLSKKPQRIESDEEAEEEEDEEEELEDELEPEEEEEDEDGESEEEKMPVRQIPPPVPSLKARIPGRPPPTLPPVGVPSIQSKLKEALSAGATAATPPVTLTPMRPKESEALTRLREKLAATAVRPPSVAVPPPGASVSSVTPRNLSNPVANPLDPTPPQPVGGAVSSPVKIKHEEEEKPTTPPPHAPGSIRVVNTAKLLAQPIQEQMKRIGPPESVIRGMLGGPMPPGGPHGPPPMFYNRPTGPPPRGLPPGMDPGRFMQRPLHPAAAAHHLQHQQRRFPDRFMYGPGGGFGGGYYPPAPYPPQEVRPVPVPADYEPPMAADDEPPTYAPASAPPDGPGEFGGLVSYFSSQREEEAELDT